MINWYILLCREHEGGVEKSHRSVVSSDVKNRAGSPASSEDKIKLQDYKEERGEDKGREERQSVERKSSRSTHSAENDADVGEGRGIQEGSRGSGQAATHHR